MLADEVHARPPEPLETPSRATHVAVLVDPEEREAERQHIARLFARFDLAAPAAGATQFSVQLGPLRLKWERHGEFSGYFFIVAGAGDTPFGEPATLLLPDGWLRSIPGRTVAAAHARLLRADAGTPDPLMLAQHFGARIVIGSEIADGAGAAFTDFHVHDDGCLRFVVFDRGMTPRQAGRMVQRLFEIDVYRMLALLALPIARRQSPRVLAIERSLAELTDGMGRGDGEDEALLHELTRLAAEVESGLAASQFRFGACRAYSDLVATRIEELRERRIQGTQTIEEFMARRFTPAVATCASVSQRLRNLSDRVAQASSLLATRVGIAREKQNQSLLASMDRRAKLQLRLQQTVEGLSIAAIVYYAAGLVGYVAKGFKSVGIPLSADLATGIAVPLLAVAALFTVRRARRHATEGSERARTP